MPRRGASAQAQDQAQDLFAEPHTGSAALSRYVSAGAKISACGKYRYRLWREWRLHPLPARWSWWKDDNGRAVVDGKGSPIGEPDTCLFVMLNPSTADGETDDPTIRRCVGFAKSWGFDRMEVVNLFAYRATDPREILALGHAADPVGVWNQEEVGKAATDAKLIVCAWGAHGGHLGQDETMRGWLTHRRLHTLGRLTKGGHPRHPLYIRTSEPLVSF